MTEEKFDLGRARKWQKENKQVKYPDPVLCKLVDQMLSIIAEFPCKACGGQDSYYREIRETKCCPSCKGTGMEYV